MLEPEATLGPARSRGDEVRCECGSLLARYVGGQVEVKCRRCKRTVLLPILPEGCGEAEH